MSHWQELIAAALWICELEERNATSSPALQVATKRLRAAIANVRQRGPGTFETFSGVNGQNSGFVELRGPALPATMPAATAIELGRNLIEAGATAETEAALAAELRANDLGDEVLAALLNGMRRRRQDTDEQT